MRIPHFLTLAQIDKLHFITACRSGVIHLTWARATVRFDRDEFRHVARLLSQAAGAQPPASLREGDLCAILRPGEDCEFQMGPIVLRLSPVEFQQLAQIAQEAIDRLDEILAAGVWDQPDEGESPSDTLDPAGQVPFSKN
jgi:hypothetical protein